MFLLHILCKKITVFFITYALQKLCTFIISKTINICVVCLTGSFEIALLRLCRAFDVQQNSVIFGENFITLDAFQSLGKFQNWKIRIILIFTMHNCDHIGVFIYIVYFTGSNCVSR